MNIPDDDGFLTDLILQRTRPYIALAGKEALAHWTKTGDKSRLLPALGSREAVSQYVDAAIKEIAADVESYRWAIADRNIRRVVSIGCGNGIAEAILCRSMPIESVLLVDIEIGGRGHGFGDNPSGYGSLSRAEAFMRDNGVTCAIEKWNPAKQPEPLFRFDLLFSMYAMGFHFPAEDYDGFIDRNRKRGALVIYDSRNGRIVGPA